ncbi:hypothetical protein EC991_004315 [Linnemannia zychae]|nr:hypothetical protein EC991_004315 [Linnemannia zychae]
MNMFAPKEMASEPLHSAADKVQSTKVTLEDTAGGPLHSATDKVQSTKDTVKDMTSESLHSVSDKVQPAKEAVNNMAYKSLHSAGDKVHSAKEGVKRSILVQKYVVRPAVYSKGCIETGSTTATRYVKSEMSLTQAVVSLAMVIIALGWMTVSDFSFDVTKDKVVVTKFSFHPPTLLMTLLMSISVGLVSILLTLGIPLAFSYARVYVLGPRCSDKEHKQTTSSSGLGSGMDGQSTFEAYPKQTDKTSIRGGYHSNQGPISIAADATAAAAAAAASKKEE